MQSVRSHRRLQGHLSNYLNERRNRSATGKKLLEPLLYDSVLSCYGMVLPGKCMVPTLLEVWLCQAATRSPDIQEILR